MSYKNKNLDFPLKVILAFEIQIDHLESKFSKCITQKKCKNGCPKNSKIVNQTYFSVHKLMASSEICFRLMSFAPLQTASG